MSSRSHRVDWMWLRHLEVSSTIDEYEQKQGHVVCPVSAKAQDVGDWVTDSNSRLMFLL